MSRQPRQGGARPGDAALEKTRAERRRAERRANRGRGPKAALLGMIVVALLVSSLYPARTLVAKRNRIAALTRESAELDRRIAALRAQRDLLQTDEEVERLAREQLGMIRPGEVAFAVVPGQSPLPAPPPRVTAAPPRGSADGTLVRWWDAFRRSLALPR